MADFYIDDATVPDGCSTGLIPRDYEAFPVGCYASAVPMQAVANMPLIPQSEWSDRIREQETNKTRLSDIRNRGMNGSPIPSLDQNGNGYQDGMAKWGYCWTHSSTHAVMLCRAVANSPYVPLSAFAVAATIKNGRNQGGWGAQSLDFIGDRGVPSQQFWPQKDVNLRNGTAECWDNAKLHRMTEGWIDLDAAQYDRNLTFAQVATCLLSGIPVVGDFNWWGHSVCLMDLVETSPGRFGVRIWNSWADSWGENGTGILSGSKAIPDGAVAPRVVTPSIV